jgi:hypothetical protein
MPKKLLLRVAFLELPRDFLSPKRDWTDTPKGPGLVGEEGQDALQGQLGTSLMTGKNGRWAGAFARSS